MHRNNRFVIMEILKEQSLRAYNTFGIDVETKLLTSVSSIDDLREVLSSEALKREQKLILGGGSNVLFTHDYNGLVMLNRLKGISLLKEDDEHFWVKVAAGENWHNFVMTCVEMGWAGLENLSLIPGNVGASPMQNIGAYGVEMKDCFEELEALHIESLELIRFSHAECEFGYRESVFKRRLKDQFVITSVTFRLNKRPEWKISYGAIEQQLQMMGVKELSLRAVSDAVIAIRRSKLPDPAELGNAGSFFKNPVIEEELYNSLKEQYPDIVGYPSGNQKVKLAAGWLIEKAGWKGFRDGDAGVHKLQALVLVNYGKSSGTDIYNLSEQVIQDVQSKFGVILEREVNIL